MSQLIYSTEPVDNADGRKVKNPRHFVAPVEGVTKVYIAGDWPNVRAAYEAQKVPVASIEEMRALPGKSKSEKAPPPPPEHPTT